MLPPAFYAWWHDSSDFMFFLIPSVLGSICSLLMIVSNLNNQNAKIEIQESYIITLSVWLSTAVIGAIPFFFGSIHLSWIDSLFQSVSMITTTGANVIINVEGADQAIIMWCCIMQWLGGKGIIVMALILIPVDQVNYISLIQSETIDQVEKVTPRLMSTVLRIFYLYITLTAICAFCFFIEGMSPYDAICHSLTTLSTGGFSTWNQSIQYVSSPVIQLTFCVFMFLAGANFLILLLAKQEGLRFFFRDPQIRGYTKMLILTVSLVSVWRFFQGNEEFGSVLIQSLFNVISALSTTGFVTADYSNWGGLALMVFFFLPIIGGCTGSTAGGLKIYRLQMLLANVFAQLRKARWPRSIFTPRLYGRALDDSAMMTVTNFFFMYMLTIVVLCLLAGLTDLDFMTTISGVVATLTNLGPGLGEMIGPSSTYYSVPDAAKIIFILSMLLGRLELVVFFVVLVPRFWRK
jgi:trk system potassium uptake protein TrkH